MTGSLLNLWASALL